MRCTVFLVVWPTGHSKLGECVVGPQVSVYFLRLSVIVFGESVIVFKKSASCWQGCQKDPHRSRKKKKIRRPK